jgi:hypothetical protein
MTEILPRLFLGDFAVNCTFELPFRNPKAEAQVRIPLPDPPSDESHIITMLDVLRGDLLDKIDACACAGAGAGSHPVLIHCYRGAQRSAAVCAAYLMYKFHIPAAEACAFLRARRPQVFRADPPSSDENLMHVNYLQALLRFEEHCKVARAT